MIIYICYSFISHLPCVYFLFSSFLSYLARCSFLSSFLFFCFFSFTSYLFVSLYSFFSFPSDFIFVLFSSTVYFTFLFSFPPSVFFSVISFILSSHFLRLPVSALLCVPKERAFCRTTSPPSVKVFAFPLVGSFLRIGSLGSSHRLQQYSVHDSTSGVPLQWNNTRPISFANGTTTISDVYIFLRLISARLMHLIVVVLDIVRNIFDIHDISRLGSTAIFRRLIVFIGLYKYCILFICVIISICQDRTRNP